MKISQLSITVVGLGLIGGSYAMALKELNPKNLWAVDINKNVIDIAEKRKIIDKGYIYPEIPLSNSDVVIICLYPSMIVNFIKQNLMNFKKGAIITDVAGIKSNVLNQINEIIPKHLDFVGGHPMAGNEYKGFDYASKNLFSNMNYILTPTSNNNEKSVNIIECIVRQIGCKNVIKVNCDMHDEIIALTSQLTHVMAVALVNSNESNININPFIGGSFTDVSRVALINEQLWSELLLSNKKNIVNKIEIFEKNLKGIKNAIINNDKDYLNIKFNQASCRRRELM